MAKKTNKQKNLEDLLWRFHGFNYLVSHWNLIISAAQLDLSQPHKGNFPCVFNSVRECKKSISERIKLSNWNINRRMTTKNAIVQYPQGRQSVVKL